MENNENGSFVSGFFISRKIEIDAGHRVPDHGSKCRNFHGHRYVIEAMVQGELQPIGQERGMVMDFGFVKEEMVDEIDVHCDHGMILSVHDPLLYRFVEMDVVGIRGAIDLLEKHPVPGSQAAIIGSMGKVCVIADSPTAEVLACHWFHRLAPRIELRSEGKARLVELTVHETPNCRASYGVNS